MSQPHDDLTTKFSLKNFFILKLEVRLKAHFAFSSLQFVLLSNLNGNFIPSYLHITAEHFHKIFFLPTLLFLSFLKWKEKFRILTFQIPSSHRWIIPGGNFHFSSLHFFAFSHHQCHVCKKQNKNFLQLCIFSYQIRWILKGTMVNAFMPTREIPIDDIQAYFWDITHRI